MTHTQNTVNLYRTHFAQYCEDLEARRAAAVKKYSSPEHNTSLQGIDTQRMSGTQLGYHQMMMGCIFAGKAAGTDIVTASFDFLGYLHQLEAKLDAVD